MNHNILPAEAVDVLLYSRAVQDVLSERVRQHALFGDQSGLHIGHLLAVLTEEVGEAATCVADICRGRDVEPNTHDLYVELSQVAAFAIQWMQIIDAAAASTPEPVSAPAVSGTPDTPVGPVPAIPATAWRETSTTNIGQRKNLTFFFSPDHPLPNISDVRGDVSHCTDGTHCRFGIKVKCEDGHELQLRGPGRNRTAAQLAAEAIFPLVAAWAAALAASGCRADGTSPSQGTCAPPAVSCTPDTPACPAAIGGADNAAL